MSQGSSPLARGLPRMSEAPPGLSRIIPARAGFTRGRREEAGRSRDHPRSRGVYGARAAARTRLEGSSPLARGLHILVILPWDGRGIIPARAGFTRELGYYLCPG